MADPDDVSPGELGAHPDLAGTAAGMRAEWRAEQEELTAAAATIWRHGRTLVDELVAAGHRGAPVTARCGAHRWTGPVIEVADDRIALRAAPGRVDVHLGAAAGCIVHVLTPTPDADLPVPTRVVETMRARLLALEAVGAEVALGVAGEPEPLVGGLAVGADHVEVRPGATGAVLVPWSALAWVALRP